ncbi:MAG: hypothetical protein AVDCRST_MAG66-3794 [uncultured Pseudonocardia sp.]|uniref:Beta-ketoacyl synthase-like N-terminal domain-containing protein n=1 Tax=uncultured Pseudonocardia sp. TaxID=211455 RepID=A0A6J4Q2A0_9PSEU|nr:MAG: hypothetical protein AVDCRST_MAG66-3794 [uncultured Pseudonocardia sp.]
MTPRVVLRRWAVDAPRWPGGTDGAIPAHERAAEVLGRKGLLGTEPATRSALCAVHRLLGLADGAARNDGEPDPSTAVVVSSNLGNAATVAGVARTVRASGVRAASPLDAPNASSNVLASAVALRFRFGGPNVTVCSGHPSGLDAIGLGRLLIVAGRARRSVVVGVEPGGEVAEHLCPGIGGGAVGAVVLEADDGEPDGSPLLGPVVDDRRAGGSRLRIEHGDGDRDIDVDGAGSTYGARGVLQVALGAAALHADPAARAAHVTCGAAGDGFRSTHLGRNP